MAGKPTVLATVLAFLMLGACGRSAVECGDTAARDTAMGVIRAELEQLTRDAVRGEADVAVGISRIRAAIADVRIAIDDVRTTRQDPNSTKRQCTGTLSVGFAAATLTSADRARRAAGMNTVSDLAAENDIERNADRFGSAFEFEVQPTDDGSKVYAETQTGTPMLRFVAEVLAADLLRSTVENNDRLAQQRARDAAAAEELAVGEQRSANLDVARADNQLAVQSIGALWQAVPRAARARLLPIQRAWIRKKEADCAIEAASVSVDPQEREAARLACDTRMTNERIPWVAQYRGAEEPEQSPAMTQPAYGDPPTQEGDI